MIAIVNVSKKCKPYGIHEYEVRINRDVVCKFTHRREHNLETCLRHAADAVEKARIEAIYFKEK